MFPSESAVSQSNMSKRRGIVHTWTCTPSAGMVVLTFVESLGRMKLPPPERKAKVEPCVVVLIRGINTMSMTIIKIAVRKDLRPFRGVV